MNTNTPISVSNGYSVSGTAQRGSEDSSLIKNYKKLFKFNLTRTAGGQLVSSIKGSLSNQGHSAGETAKKVGAVFGKTLVLIATVPFFIAGDASAFGLGIIVTGLAILPVGSYKAALAIRDIIHRNTVSMATLRGFDGSKVPTEITTANEKECVRKVFNLTTGQFLPLKDIVDVLDGYLQSDKKEQYLYTIRLLGLAYVQTDCEAKGLLPLIENMKFIKKLGQDTPKILGDKEFLGKDQVVKAIINRMSCNLKNDVLSKSDVESILIGRGHFFTVEQLVKLLTKLQSLSVSFKGVEKDLLLTNLKEANVIFSTETQETDEGRLTELYDTILPELLQGKKKNGEIQSFRGEFEDKKTTFFQDLEVQRAAALEAERAAALALEKVRLEGIRDLIELEILVVVDIQSQIDSNKTEIEASIVAAQGIRFDSDDSTVLAESSRAFRSAQTKLEEYQTKLDALVINATDFSAIEENAEDEVLRGLQQGITTLRRNLEEQLTKVATEKELLTQVLATFSEIVKEKEGLFGQKREELAAASSTAAANLNSLVSGNLSVGDEDPATSSGFQNDEDDTRSFLSEFLGSEA